VDELTDPEQALVAPPARPGDRIGRAAVTITVWNLVSRISGFARVVVTAAALGIVALGDAYQSANLVSNILFELLAGGLLFSVLVPTFVVKLDSDRRDEARAMAGVLLIRALVVLGALVVISIALAPQIMQLLTSGVSDPVRRHQEVVLGGFLLWFIMPQLLLYAIGAVATALLQADRRFVAAAVAPFFNNLVVIATMVAFAAVHDPKRGIDLTVGEKVILGGGTLAGTVALTVVPLVALRRAGLGARLRWNDPTAKGLGALARKGAWGAGDIGLNQVMVVATVVFAGRVDGGVIAYQTAFTFFVLPHAILAYPIFTALFPRLSAHGAAGDLASFAADVAGGVRAMALLLVPAAALLAVVALPLLTLARRGQFTTHGVQLVASVLVAYMVGLLGYSAFFLLTRASYAIDDVRSPTMVYLWTTVAAIIGMAIASSLADGSAKVVVLGLVHGVAVSLGSVGLYVRLRRRAGHPIPVLAALARAAGATVVAAGLAWLVVGAVGWRTNVHAMLAIAAAGTVGVVVYVGLLAAARTPELDPVWARARRLRGPRPA